jgi:hypothetical protein
MSIGGDEKTKSCAEHPLPTKDHALGEERHTYKSERSCFYA